MLFAHAEAAHTTYHIAYYVPIVIIVVLVLVYFRYLSKSDNTK